MSASEPGGATSFVAPDFAAERTALRSRLVWLERETSVVRMDLQMVEAALLVQNNRERLKMDPDGFLAAHPRGALSVRVKTPIKSGSQRDQVVNLLAAEPDRDFTAEEVRAALNISGSKNVRNLLAAMAREELLVKVAPAVYRWRPPESSVDADSADGDFGILALPPGTGESVGSVAYGGASEGSDTPNYWRPSQPTNHDGLDQMIVPAGFLTQHKPEVSPDQPVNGYR